MFVKLLLLIVKLSIINKRSTIVKTNICIVGLYQPLIKEIAKSFSDKTEMFFADVDDLIQFDLQDIARATEICGADYVKKIERGKVKNVCSYENTCITLNTYLLNESSNYDMIQSSAVIIYLRLDKKEYAKKLGNNPKEKSLLKIDTEMFEVRDKLLRQKSDIVINCDGMDTSSAVNEIMKNLVEYYNKE